MFLKHETEFFTGIALKKSVFSNKENFLQSILTADKYHKFTIIDYEGVNNLLTPRELEQILSQMKNLLVFTIAVRGREFHFSRKYLFENYLRLKRRFRNLVFCLVAGNTYYRSIDLQIPVINAFNNLLTRMRRKSSASVFIGAEGLSTQIICEFEFQYGPIIPFLLHGDPRAILSDSLPVPLSVYSPIVFNVSEEEAIKPLLGYLLRRKDTRARIANQRFILCAPPFKWEDIIPEIQTILLFSFNQCVLTSTNLNSRINAFFKNNIRLIVGYPAISSQMFELIRDFSIRPLTNQIR